MSQKKRGTSWLVRFWKGGETNDLICGKLSSKRAFTRKNATGKFEILFLERTKISDQNIDL